MISFFGEVHNPWDITRVAGGSSGGSAASVAAGLGFAAVGTDTAGSIRLPAAYCGVVGLKPTYGRVSTRGVVPLSSSYDHVGPITNSVYDAALMLQVLAGYDAADPASIDAAVPDFVAAIAQLVAHLIDSPLAESAHRRAAGIFLRRSSSRDRRRHRKSNRDFSPNFMLRFDEVKLEVSTDRTLASAEAYAYHKSFVSHHRSSTSPRRSRAFNPEPKFPRIRCSSCQPRSAGEPSRHPGNI